MNLYVDELMVRERLNEARARAAWQAQVKGIRSVGRPVRQVLGLALIRMGHWVAGRAPRRVGAPRRATA
jgi:hypothetical protein